MVVPLFVGREKSIIALEQAMQSDKQVMLVAQRDAGIDDPSTEDVFDIGTIANILQLLKLPDGTVKVLVEGADRAQLENMVEQDGYFRADVSAIHGIDIDPVSADEFIKVALASFEGYVNTSKKVPSEVMSSLVGLDEPSRLVDTMAAHMALSVADKQAVLEMPDTEERYAFLAAKMDSEADIIQVEKRIRGRVKKQMEKSQREYYLNEQMKAIQKELGEMDDAPNELEEFKRKITESGMSAEAAVKATNELNKLKMMSPMSAEASVVRSYLDWMTNVPWKKRSKVRHDLPRAEQILNDDHYGLEEVKDRILEYLAVQQRVRKLKGPVLCLVGPPGVGKTSLGESIAKATNRKFIRMALGGVRDEAEIRGHRRTYIGSLPGKIVQKLSKVGVKNPLFLLDEIDKMGMDHRGDPASALLEVLDPEQNHNFADHYLEVDYDLSEVMFICTANSLNIPGPLLDRMEVIRLPGYTEDEKVNIAQRYLEPKQQKNAGLKKGELIIDESAIRDLVRYYTREAGVRNLEREIAKICRKTVKNAALTHGKSSVTVDAKLLEEYAGVRKFSHAFAEEKNQVGQVTGLAWTQVGGELLTIEAVSVVGKGRHIHTGSLGDVMQESISAATTVVRSRSKMLGIRACYHDKHDIHIHIPEGATPKDGPSAGIGMCTALVSVITGIPVRSDVAMTGEITLRGQVLAIGGLKEKMLAAHRGGIKTIIIPDENVRDLKEIPDNIKADLEIKPVKWIDEVLAIALESQPVELTEEEYMAGYSDQNVLKAEENRINTH
jgi:ATP-dependent Lon protease